MRNSSEVEFADISADGGDADRNRPWLGILRDTSRPIWERMGEVAEMLPADLIADLPKDGSRNLDHYLYGSPKQAE